MEEIYFAYGFLAGFALMWVIAKRLSIEWKKEIEELKDFDKWKEWKNN